MDWDHLLPRWWLQVRLPHSQRVVKFSCKLGAVLIFPFLLFPDQTEFTFSGLMPTSEYTFSVVAQVQDGESSPQVVTASTSKDLPCGNF